MTYTWKNSSQSSIFIDAVGKFSVEVRKKYSMVLLASTAHSVMGLNAVSNFSTTGIIVNKPRRKLFFKLEFSSVLSKGFLMVWFLIWKVARKFYAFDIQSHMLEMFSFKFYASPHVCFVYAVWRIYISKEPASAWQTLSRHNSDARVENFPPREIFPAIVNAHRCRNSEIKIST